MNREDDEKSVLERGPPGAESQVAPSGGLQGRIQHGHFTGAAQPTGEFHVFHQRDGSKTAERLKGFSPNEN